jgi:hypothetical protein
MLTMTPRELEEYKALRATIRERGTARVWLCVAGLALWCALVLATAASMSLPIATLLPLLVLAGTFEAMFSLHTGVERVGRYIQVFYERDEELSVRRWEHTAMAFGQLGVKGGTDPLFGTLFMLAAIANFVPAVLAGAVPIEWAVVGTVHLAFIARVFIARHHAAQQRALDLARFEQLKHAGTSGPLPR